MNYKQTQSIVNEAIKAFPWKNENETGGEVLPEYFAVFINKETGELVSVGKVLKYAKARTGITRISSSLTLILDCYVSISLAQRLGSIFHISANTWEDLAEDMGSLRMESLKKWIKKEDPYSYEILNNRQQYINEQKTKKAA